MPSTFRTRFFSRICVHLAVVAVLASDASRADEGETATQLSAQTRATYARVNRAFEDLSSYLKAIEFENTAFVGTNYFAVSVGGIDALQDLEQGRGVDPETFAALYAGWAVPSVAEHLNLKRVKDAAGRTSLKVDSPDGRLRYKGAAVRLYSPDRLRELFDRRESFRTDNERKRQELFAEFIFNRRRELGSLGQGKEGGEGEQLADRYAKILPLVMELDSALQGEVSATSIISGVSGQNHFGLSTGGINALDDLSQTQSVDPETFAAIYAQRITADIADSFQYPLNGKVLYQDQPVKMYSTEKLMSLFQKRERLSLTASTR